MSLQGVAPLVTINGRVMDPWSITTPLVIRVGRESPTTQAEANSCSFGLLGPLPPQVRMNAPVEVYLAWGGGGVWTDVWDDLWSDTLVIGGDPEERITRFNGRVTDLNPTSEGGLVQTEVVATGEMGDLGRVRTGTAAYPVETEDDRVQRLAAEASGAGIELMGTGYDWQMCAREVESASVLDVLYDTATAGGLVHETIEGVTQFDHWDARSSSEPVCWLSPSDLEDSVAWSQQIDAFIKRAVIRYGIPAEGNSEQPQVVVGERGWGKPEQVISTFLNKAADATRVGELVLARWGDPDAFEAPLLNVVASYVSRDTWDAVMGLAFGDIVVAEGVTPSPAALPQGRNEWFVEGWSEEYERAGNGPVRHRVALSVSDRARFRPDLGEPTRFTSITVTPASAVMGTLRTVDATLSTEAGLPVTKGVCLVTYGAAELGRGTVAADGTVRVTLWSDTLIADDAPYVLTLAYAGVWPDYLSCYGSTDPVTVSEPVPPPDPPLASVSCTVSPSVVREGQPVTATAALGMTGKGSKAGKVLFAVTRDNGTTWTTYATVVTKKDTTKVSAKWTATAGSLPAKIRAAFNPDLANVLTVYSARDVEVQSKQSRTLGYPSTWWAGYKGNGTPQTYSRAHQGYHNTATGQEKALFGFAVPDGEWAGWTITKVEVYLRFESWTNKTGTARIGSHDYTAAPPSSPGYKAGRTNVSGWKQGLGKWVNITGWGKPLATGALKGIVIGPGGDQTATWHGYASVGGADIPTLRVTGYRWA